MIRDAELHDPARSVVWRDQVIERLRAEDRLPPVVALQARLAFRFLRFAPAFVAAEIVAEQ